MMLPRVVGAMLAACACLAAPTGLRAADLGVTPYAPARFHATGREFGRCVYFDFIGRPHRVFTNDYSCNIVYRSNLAAGYNVAWQPGRHGARKHRL